jgi:hypothetical protein
VKSQAVNGALSVLDVTGSVSKLSVKQKRSSSDYVLQVNGTVEDGANGLLNFSALPAATAALAPGVYVYDVQVTLSGGAVHTVVLDSFEVKEDITVA